MTDFTTELIRVAQMNYPTRNLINESNATVLEALATHMVEVNKEMNLTAITDTDGIILKHIVDSIAIVPIIDSGESVVDVGCGGGFPSLPLAILRPDVSILGLDSVTKKVNYVRDTASLLGLSNVEVSNMRAEVLGQDKNHREKYDVACARGVGKLNLICELCLPLVKVDGIFIAMKALTAKEELDEAENAISALGGCVERVIDYFLSNGKETLSRSMIIIKKLTHTPQKYPRNNSQISKKPL